MSPIEEQMLAGFQTLSREQQARYLILAGNAEFVIRTIGENTDNDSIVLKTAQDIRKALMRSVPKPHTPMNDPG